MTQLCLRSGEMKNEPLCFPSKLAQSKVMNVASHMLAKQNMQNETLTFSQQS